MSDDSLNKDLGFLRVGAAVPVLRVADVDFNVGNIIEAMKKARDEGVQVLSFPGDGDYRLYPWRPGATPGTAGKG